MFDLLKKKLNDFKNKIAEKIVQKSEETTKEEITKPTIQTESIEEKPTEIDSIIPQKVEKSETKKEPVFKDQEPILKEEIEPEPIKQENVSGKILETKLENESVFEGKKIDTQEKIESAKETVETIPKIKETQKESIVSQEIKEEVILEPISKPIEPIYIKKETAKPIIQKETETIEEKTEEIKPVEHEPIKQEIIDETRELKAKIGLTQKISSFVFGSITIKESDIVGFLDELELSLLEADVEQQTAEDIVKGIKKELSGKKIGRGTDVSEFLKDEIKKIIENMMEVEPINLDHIINTRKPAKILFLGPNGAGKTTTIAKIANLLQKRNKKVILASADTFRAGAIEQIEVHAERIGVRVIKHDYKADPAAVAYDAIKAAKTGHADVVLIDSAGRQETNKNLMEELNKINRVVKPDLKIFVGEALAGHTIVNQAKKFNEEIGLDGFILTKLDTDTKGGTSISLIHELKKPIIFIGLGQGYNDIKEFKPSFIVSKLFV